MRVLQPDTIRHFITNPSFDGSRVYQDAWSDPEGTVLCMDERQGTLRSFISPDNQLSEIDWFQIMFGMASHLADAHAQGQVHKDLKPSNGITPASPMHVDMIVLVDLTEQYLILHSNVRLTDYGVQPLSRIQLAGNHTIPGTLSYWAPEIRLLGNAATAQTDIWALGCIGYEMCLGQALSQNNNRAALDTRIRGGPMDLSALDHRFGYHVRYILGSCLEYNSSLRWSAMDIRNYIQNLFRQTGLNTFG